MNHKQQKPPEEKEVIAFGQGFPLAVTIILVFFMIAVVSLVASFYKTNNAAAARLVYLAAQAKAIEFAATGNYRVPDQADLSDLIGQKIDQNALIEIVDDNKDANIDYIIYRKNGWVSTYSPGQLETEKEKLRQKKSD
jgi:hypothetical protein